MGHLLNKHLNTQNCLIFLKKNEWKNKNFNPNEYIFFKKIKDIHKNNTGKFSFVFLFNKLKKIN